MKEDNKAQGKQSLPYVHIGYMLRLLYIYLIVINNFICYNLE